MPGPLPKPENRRQRRNVRASVTARGPRIVRIPDPPKGLLKHTVAAWERYWSSDVAAAVEAESDMPIVVRLFHLYDDHERARRAYTKRPLVIGSQGQPVLNPLGRVRTDLEKEIRQLEDRLGMNPKARIALGIQMTEATKSLNDLMSGANPYDDADEDSEDEKALHVG